MSEEEYLQKLKEIRMMNAQVWQYQLWSSKFRYTKSNKLFPKCKVLQRILWPGICVKSFLSFPQKNLSPEKTEKN